MIALSESAMEFASPQDRRSVRFIPATKKIWRVDDPCARNNARQDRALLIQDCDGTRMLRNLPHALIEREAAELVDETRHGSARTITTVAVTAL